MTILLLQAEKISNINIRLETPIPQTEKAKANYYLSGGTIPLYPIFYFPSKKMFIRSDPCLSSKGLR